LAQLVGNVGRYVLRPAFGELKATTQAGSLYSPSSRSRMMVSGSVPSALTSG
jgi:hypothetical protein